MLGRRFFPRTLTDSLVVSTRTAYRCEVKSTDLTTPVKPERSVHETRSESTTAWPTAKVPVSAQTEDVLSEVEDQGVAEAGAARAPCGERSPHSR